MASDTKVVIRSRMVAHVHFRKSFGGVLPTTAESCPHDLTGCGMLKPSAQLLVKFLEDVVYGIIWDHPLKLSLKASKGIEDTLDHDS